MTYWLTGNNDVELDNRVDWSARTSSYERDVVTNAGIDAGNIGSSRGLMKYLLQGKARGMQRIELLSSDNYISLELSREGEICCVRT